MDGKIGPAKRRVRLFIMVRNDRLNDEVGPSFIQRRKNPQ
jgi:hypothetical protein